MYHFWGSVIKPLFDILQPRSITEIGADFGHNTRNILEYCRQTKSRAHIIDPFPKFEPEAFKSEYGDIFDFYRSLSLNALPIIPHMDAVLIDGDHNWYTVYHELKIIEKKCQMNHSEFPLIVIHDVDWPYARRDLYYHPDNIPEAFRMPYLQRGLNPDSKDMMDQGGLNPHLYNSIYEHNFRSGVLTAVEDFIKETDIPLMLKKISGFFGLGILYSSHHEATYPMLSDLLQKCSPPDIISDILKAVEKSRIENWIAYEEHRNKLRSVENAKRRESEAHEREQRKIEKEVKKLETMMSEKDDQLSILEAKSREAAEKFIAERNKFNELEENRLSERESFKNQIQQYQQKIQALEQVKNKLRTERDQLAQWINKFRVQFNALLQSNRWKTGHALISLLTMSMFKKNFTMVTDHMEKQFKRFEQLHLSENALLPDISIADPKKYPIRFYNLTVAVIAWDVGHNPLGRAYLLAEALSRYFHVIILGPSFPRYNHQVWEPLSNSNIEVLPLPGKTFPEFLSVLGKVSSRIPADIIVSCKARLPSMQLGLMMKAFKNRPLFFDIDDYELAFFNHKTSLTIEEIKNNKYADLDEPFEETWTRFSEDLLKYADGLFVSNSALQKKFGGMIVPHARDEFRFDPSLYDKTMCRNNLGVRDSDKIVLFLGTPREHKGVVEVLNAIINCGHSDYKLCVIGTPPDKSYEKKLRRIGGESLILLPDQPFGKLPENLIIADLVCLIQKEESDISKYQLPAKVVDALAMGIPVLATRTAPLEALIQAGVIEPVTIADLSIKIDQMLSNRDSLRSKQLEKRILFLQQYSYKAIGEKIVNEMLHSLKSPKKLPHNVLDFQEIQKKLPSREPVEKNQSEEHKGWDIVLFWKQNDTGIYGRRSDMLIKYLSRRSQIRKIAVFDMPISIEALRNKGKQKGIVHDRLIYRETMLRDWGIRDTDKVSFHTFIYRNDRSDEAKQVWRSPDKNDYMQFIENRLKDLKIRPTHSIFWFYPQNSYITKIAKQFQPKLKIVDLVDDHRTWPDLSEVKKLYISNHYKEVLKIADLSFANCQNVQQSFQKYFQGIQLIPNGCELEPPSDFFENKQFQKFKSIKGPKLGYVGNLEQGKIDIGLIKYLAVNRPDWNIILIGSTHANPHILELDEYPNIYFFGVIQYPDVRAWIQAFDVAILPHLNSEKTQSMNPLKLYVYCAIGVPVVSTDIENLDELKSFILIAGSYDDFSKKIEYLIQEKRKSISSDLKICLENNSWDKRVDQVIDAINEKWR